MSNSRQFQRFEAAIANRHASAVGERHKDRRKNNFRTSVVGQVANLPVQPKTEIQRQVGNLPHGTYSSADPNRSRQGTGTLFCAFAPKHLPPDGLESIVPARSERQQ